MELFLSGISSRPLREELNALELEDPMELRRAGFKLVAELVEVKARAEKFQPPTSKATPLPRRDRPDYTPRRHDQEQQQPPAVRCFNCNRLGHYASTCKFRVETQPTRDPPPTVPHTPVVPKDSRTPHAAFQTPTPKRLVPPTPKAGPMTRSMSYKKFGNVSV